MSSPRRVLGFLVSSLVAGAVGWAAAVVVLVTLSLLVFLPLGIHDPYDPFLMAIYAAFQAGAMALWARRFFREGGVPVYAWSLIAALAVAVPLMVHLGSPAEPSEADAMPIRGPLTHIDMSIRDPERSIPFYAAFFGALGYRRLAVDLPGFTGERPRRACWSVRYPGSRAGFGIEVRPASEESRDKGHDRYAPGLHHMAFHAEGPEDVDRVHEAMKRVGATVLDPPADYSGRPAYEDGYYAVFFADPDGVKLEVAYIPSSNR